MALADTNVLVEALFQDAAHHVAARRLLDRAQDGEVELCVAPQVLAEFYAVVTRSKQVTSLMAPDDALKAIATYLAMPGMTLLPVPVDQVARWMDLLRRHPVKGRDVFDVHLTATMLGNGVRRIYTFNIADFEPFEELDVLVP